MGRRELQGVGVLIQAGALLILTPGPGQGQAPGGGSAGPGGVRGGAGPPIGVPVSSVGITAFPAGGSNLVSGPQIGSPVGGLSPGASAVAQSASSINRLYPYYSRYAPYFGPFYTYPYNGYYGGYSPYAYAAPRSRGGAGLVGSYPDGYAAFYAPATPRTSPRAHISVRVPAGAQLWFDDTPTNTSGNVRQFDTPPLEPGSEYRYDVRARWKESGREVTQTQRIRFTPGAQVNVQFPLAANSDGEKPPAPHR